MDFFVFITVLVFASLRTADAFPVVASLPRERSDDRKCVCGSQAKFLLTLYFFKNGSVGAVGLLV